MKIRKSPIVLLAALPGGERSYIRGFGYQGGAGRLGYHRYADPDYPS